MPNLLRHRVIKPLVIAFAMLATTLVPATAAHATYGPDDPVFLEAYSPNGSIKLAGAYGTIAFDDGNTKFRYSIILCRESSYTEPNLRFIVNDTTQYGATWAGRVVTPLCKFPATQLAGEVDHGSIVRKVKVQLDAIYFDFPNTAVPVIKDTPYDNPFN